MAITLDDLCVSLGQADRTTLLSDWEWLTGASAQPLMVTVTGDVFVQLPQDGSVHFLDCVDGVLEKVADDVSEFLQRLGDVDFVAHCFRYDLVAPLLCDGAPLQEGQVWALRVPPILGGTRTTGDLEPVGLSVHLALYGQLHAQVAALPPGVAVGDISFAID